MFVFGLGEAKGALEGDADDRAADEDEEQCDCWIVHCASLIRPLERDSKRNVRIKADRSVTRNPGKTATFDHYILWSFMDATVGMLHRADSKGVTAGLASDNVVYDRKTQVLSHTRDKKNHVGSYSMSVRATAAAPVSVAAISALRSLVSICRRSPALGVGHLGAVRA